ncbi:hypothetical protein ACSBLW_06630 [Thioclava sp. FR2]|uniref:hypothetical protein n=1 Tax=Thioclava sp. FR2 TaxID=3445780 RepID=UPI003EC12B0E
MTLMRLPTTNGLPRRLPFVASSLLHHVVLACVFLFASILLAPSKAEAHGLHTTAHVVETADDTGSGASDMVPDVDECKTLCCSPATCASALLSTLGHAHGLTTLSAAYALPSDTRAEARPQTALKRPPRS